MTPRTAHMAATLAAVLAIEITGCTALITRSVDTQPRVAFKDEDYRRPGDIVAGEPVVYTADLGSVEDGIDADLVRYAPVLVQGFQPKRDDRGRYAYAYESDAIGTPILSADGKSVRVETSKPASFCRVAHAQALGRTLKQLVYVFWYPRRPVGAIETGEVDGNILRITLDASGRPAVFEYSQTCGCFHGLFVSEHVEAWARWEFGKPLDGKRYVIEDTHPEHTDWLVRDLVRIGADGRVVLFLSAGKHFCRAMRSSSVLANCRSLATRRYVLQPYGRLLNVDRQGGGTGSIFNDKGLVLGGKRSKEELFLAGLDNPGWPRHLDKMLIHWDQARWIDPDLLAENLRLPKKMGDERATPVPAPGSTGQGPRRGPPLDERIRKPLGDKKPYLVLFTHKLCMGCRKFKRDVLPRPKVRAAIKAWSFVQIDLFTEEGGKLSETHRISVTPVAVLFDRKGNEIARSEDIDTAEKFLKHLAAAKRPK